MCWRWKRLLPQYILQEVALALGQNGIEGLLIGFASVIYPSSGPRRTFEARTILAGASHDVTTKPISVTTLPS